MITFILIFFVMVIAVGISAVGRFSIYLKCKNKSLDTNNRKQFDEPPKGYRSLFAPDGRINGIDRLWMPAGGFPVEN